MEINVSLDIYVQDWYGRSYLKSVSFDFFCKNVKAVDFNFLGEMMSSKKDLQIPHQPDSYLKIPSEDLCKYEILYKNNDNYKEYICYTKIMPIHTYVKTVNLSKLNEGVFSYINNFIEKFLYVNDYKKGLLVGGNR